MRRVGLAPKHRPLADHWLGSSKYLRLKLVAAKGFDLVLMGRCATVCELLRATSDCNKWSPL